MTKRSATTPSAVSLTVTSKGQVTLRKELLAHLGIQPGQRVDVGRGDVRAAVERQVAERAVVGHDHEHVRPGVGRAGPGCGPILRRRGRGGDRDYD